MVLTTIICCIAALVPPVAVNQFLQYVETDGRGATVSPWVWVTLIFTGPLVSSLSLEWYLYNAAAVVYQTEGLLTQLVFDHSLRIRLKAEPAGNSDSAKKPDIPEDGDQQVESVSVDEETTATDGKLKDDVPEAAAEDRKTNLVGKINTMVTVDVGNVTASKDFLTIGMLPISFQTATNTDIYTMCSSTGPFTSNTLPHLRVPHCWMERNLRISQHFCAHASAGLPRQNHGEDLQHNSRKGTLHCNIFLY